MTNREYLVPLLQGLDPDAILYLFGCKHISIEECRKYENCMECWRHWLDSEVNTNDSEVDTMNQVGCDL